ncbi:hypothetical protein [Sulfurihydrogenibium sp. YO3AOP1]|nr:hypothetical protein [Sulfurihydrogenibium sp. YO3AOP1]
MSQQWSIKAVRTITLKIELKEEYVNSTPLGDERSKKNKLQEGRK